MTEESVEDRLRETAIKRAVPFLNGIVPTPDTKTFSGRGLEILWDKGYVPASEALIALGVSAAEINLELAKVKELLDIVEPSDLAAFPEDFHDQIITELASEIASEPPLQRQRLDERVVEAITEFRVEMFSNEPARRAPSCKGPPEGRGSEHQSGGPTRESDAYGGHCGRSLRYQGGRKK